MFIHGGGFGAGDKATKSNEALCLKMAAHGFAVVSINYYLTLKYGKTPRTGGASNKYIRLPGNGFTPDKHKATKNASNDARLALRWVKNNAKQYGLDLSSVAISGGSAGAMTALYTAYASNQKILPIKAVVNLWGCMENSNLIKKGAAPLLTYHGEKDKTINVAFAYDLEQQMKKNGNTQSETHIIKDKGHAIYTFITAQKTDEIAVFLRKAIEYPKSENCIQKDAEVISFYSGLGLKFTFIHDVKEYVPNKVSYYDIWHLWEVNEVNGSGIGQKLIQRGEWETAIKTKMGFVGGKFHGFERKSLTQFVLDGKTIDEQDNISLTSYKTFTIIQLSDLYAFNDTTEKIAEISKRWDIGNNNEIKLKQHVTWLKKQSLEAAYLTMLPVVRENNGKYITTKACRNDIKEVEDVSKVASLKFIGSDSKNAKAKCMKVWGNTYVFSVAVRRHQRLRNSSLWLWAAKQYNKIYFDYCGEYEVEQGEKFKVSSIYKFALQ